VTLGVTGVLCCVGLVDEQASGREQSRERGELIAQQAPEDEDEVEALGCARPCQGFGCGFATHRKGEACLLCSFCGKREAFVGNVGDDGVPSTLGEPEGVASGAAGEVESAAGSEVRADFDQQGIRFDGLRFACQELCVPALAIIGHGRGHDVGHRGSITTNGY
jgi:hypothetical protein